MVTGGAPAPLWRTVFSVAVIMMGSACFGFNVAFPSPALLSMKGLGWKMDPTQVNFFRSIHAGTAIVGPFLNVLLLSCFRRRVVLLVLAFATSVFWLLMLVMSVERFWVGIIARGLGGLSVGALSALCPLYIVELAPPGSSGFCGALHQVAVAGGVTVPFAIGIGLEWWGIVCVGCGLAFVAGVCSLAILDSPVSERVGAAGSNILRGAGRLFHRGYLRTTLLVAGIGALQQLCGINAILANMSELFKEAGAPVAPNVASTIAAVAKFISGLVAAPLIQKCGRRVMFLLSFGGCAACDVLYGLALKLGWWPWLAIVLIGLFLVSFSLGAAPITWFLPAELFPDDLRPAACAIVSVSVWAFTFFVILTFPYLVQVVDVWGSFIMFAGFSGLAWLVGWWHIGVGPRFGLLDQDTNAREPLTASEDAKL